MTTKSLVFQAVLMIAVSAPAFAECPGDSTLEMRQCTSEALEKAEKEMKSAYSAASSGLEPKWKEALESSQQAWTKYRDTWCDFSTSGSEGGSIRPIEMGMCMTDMAESRTKELIEFRGAPGDQL